MVPIVVFWTNYTTTVKGRVLKLVPCENCKTEYVYVLEREGVGSGTSVYGLYAETAQENAESGAEEILDQYLTNDFDPVPCPVCGHYQAFMFSKMIVTRSPWAPVAALATLVVGLMSAVVALYWGLKYLGQQDNYAISRFGTAGAVAAVAGLIGYGLSAAQRRRDRQFDPNAEEDQPSRIAKGRSRAVTRAEFEQMQQSARPQEP